MPDVLLIEPCNFENFPVGGQTTFSKQMMLAFGDRLALVGLSTDGTPVGCWMKKRFNELDYHFFAFGKRNISSTKPVVPARVTALLKIARYRKAIMSLGINYAFTQSPEMVIAIHNWPWDSLCYRIAGDANPLKISRYRWARLFEKFYDAKLFSVLKHADVILASADSQAIKSLVHRSKNLINVEQIIPFPTRVDTSIFKPQPMQKIRQKIKLDGSGPVVITCGRLNNVKGWDLIISAFQNFLRKHPRSRLIFVGDGEDRHILEKTILERGLTGYILVVGFQPPSKVVEYLNAANMFVVGSYKEGWSMAMLESLACGLPIITTDVSGARDMIVEGQNGFIVSNRDTQQFAAAMKQALVWERPNLVSLSIAQKYSMVNLAKDLCSVWSPLCNIIHEE